MIWSDSGYLLTKNKFGENSIIAEFFTKSHGKISGIIYGATSKKIRNYLQIGNLFHVNYNSKNENKLGYLNIEIKKILTPLFFEDKKKLSCIISSINLIKLLTPINESNPEIYKLIGDFYDFLVTKNWINKFIFWELDLLKVLGYDLDFKNLVTKETIGNKIIYYAISSKEKKIIPNFLIDKNDAVNDIKILLNGLKLISDYLDKSILKPNNLNYPHSRTHFVNSLK